jgi:peptide/nickel transport system ATP-binding protein
MPECERLMTPDKASDPDGLLTVDTLKVVDSRNGRLLVDGVSFEVRRGETVALVGESGSGKSLTARALVGLLPPALRSGGSATLQRTVLIPGPEARFKAIRGTQIALMMQDPFTLLSPLTTVGEALRETLRVAKTRGSRNSDLKPEVLRRLREVGIENPQALHQYPWEMSGGMRQRVGLAAAIARNPSLLIADEPTTALDSTTQREVLRLIRRLQAERGMGLLLITHDLRVAFSMSDRVLVMSQGQLVEQGTPASLRDSAGSDYTKRLLAADLPVEHRLDLFGSAAARQATTKEVTAPAGPREDRDAGSDPHRTLLTVSGLGKTYTRRRSPEGKDGPWALNDVSFTLEEGRNLGLIGESGSGKTTLAKCLIGLEKPTTGEVMANGMPLNDYSRLGRHEVAKARAFMQYVFQDPYSSLNPSHSIDYILGEAISLRCAALGERANIPAEVQDLLTGVGLEPAVAGRRTSTLSGGQRQRVAIARALAMRPQVLVCDEPVAALDVTIQAQVLQVLRNVQEERGITLLFITHDLGVVRQMTDEVLVLYRGQVVEQGPTGSVVDAPEHPYTRKLLSAVPTGDPEWLTGPT